MTELAANTIFRDFATDGSPGSGIHDPLKPEIREWGTWLESLISSGSLGDNWFATKTLLDADLAYAANTVAVVYNDATTSQNGFYVKVGASGTGSWTQIQNFIPGFQFIKATDAGAGTANAITATTSPRLSYSDGAQLVLLNIFETNTSETVTVAFDGGVALSVKTASGNNPVIGGLVAGMQVLGVVSASGTQFKLVSDQASAAIQAASEAAQGYSEEWANKAEDSPVSVAAGGDGSTEFSALHWAAKAAAAAAAASGMTVAEGRTALKTVDTTTIKSVYLFEGLRSGIFEFIAGDYSSEVAADTLEGLFIKADDTAASSGAWVRDTDHVSYDMFGVAAGNASDGDDATPAFNVWMALVRLGSAPQRFRVNPRQGSASYYWKKTAPTDIDRAIDFDGGSKALTQIVKAFDGGGSVHDSAPFKFVNGGGGSKLSNLSIVSAAASNGNGSLISLISAAGGSPDFCTFENVTCSILSSTSTHKFTLYVDGSARTIGLRNTQFTNCDVFGGGVANAFFKSCVAALFIGGGFYQAGGAASSYVDITGTVGVPSDKLIIDCAAIPEVYLTFCNDCSINVGYAAGDINNASTCTKFSGQGRLGGSVSNSWVDSEWYDPTTGTLIASAARDTIRLKNGTVTRFAIDNNGRHLINKETSSGVNAQQQIDVPNEGNGCEYKALGVGATNLQIFGDSTNGAIAYTFSNAGAILQTGISDRRLKSDITPVLNCLDAVKAIEPVSYRFTASGENSPVHYGFISQDVAAVAPHLVTEINGKLFLNRAGMDYLGWGAIRELEAKVSALEAQINGS